MRTGKLAILTLGDGGKPGMDQACCVWEMGYELGFSSSSGIGHLLPAIGLLCNQRCEFSINSSPSQTGPWREHSVSLRWQVILRRGLNGEAGEFGEDILWVIRLQCQMILSLNPCFAPVKPQLKSVHAAKDGLQSPSWVCGENKRCPSECPHCNYFHFMTSVPTL